MKASCYGSVGMAAMVSANLEEALKILEQFIGSRCDAFKPELKQEQDDVYWSIHQPLKSFQLSSDATIFVVRFCLHRKTSNRGIFFRYSAIEYARTTRFFKNKR